MSQNEQVGEKKSLKKEPARVVRPAVRTGVAMRKRAAKGAGRPRGSTPDYLVGV